MVLLGIEDADAIAIAVCDKHVVVATNKEQLRIFTHTGVQALLHAVAGPVVSMVGHKDLLGVVYHGAPTFSGSQRLKYFVWNMTKQDIVIEGDAPISPQSVLTWIGFSSSGVCFLEFLILIFSSLLLPIPKEFCE